MTLYYLWHSYEAEKKAQEDARLGRSDTFQRASSRTQRGFCIYLDDDGDPVRITSVGRDITPPSVHKDLRLVAVSENARCLVGNTGYFDDTAKEWCLERGIRPDLGGLLSYMGSPTACMRMHTKKPLTVGKPLKLKAVL